MAITGPVQQVPGKRDSGSSAVAITISAPGAGNGLVALITSTAYPTVLSISGGGATWAKAKSSDFDNWDAEGWVGPNSDGTGTSISIPNTVAGPLAAIIAEFAGIKKVSPVDQVSTKSGSGTAVTSNAITPSENGCIVFYVCAHNDSVAPSAGPTGGFTALTPPAVADQMMISAGYLIQTTAAAASPGLTLPGSAAWEMILFALKAEPAGAVLPAALIGGGFI